MEKVSKINITMLTEKLYIEGLINKLYEDIAYFDDKEVDAKTLMESIMVEEKKKTIIDDIVTEMKLAPKFIFSFGTGIGAFYDTVKKLLDGSGFYVSEYQVYLLIITAVAIIIGDSSASRLIEKTKEEGIHSVLNDVKSYLLDTEKLVNVVTKKSLGVTYSLADILGFTALLVPTMNLLSQVINDYGLNIKTVGAMTKGIILSSAVYGIKSIVRRIKDKLS
jgi:hypothetical protein